MRVRKLSDTGDYTFGSGQNNYWVNVPEGVAQVVKTTLQLVQGEWYLNVNSGTPYFQGVIGKHSKQIADVTLVSVISDVQGVVDILNYESVLDENTRKYSSISGTLNTIYGPTELDIQNERNL